ncbi:hypothetical protein JNUCC1_00564 [Lentibacillus sp. JNUCC-1]|uniref:DUF4352 domain-containing protein n=1 Tax=Lentibacillus sp. JNUCC-1 TaxID=2654513 RepID=UPI0012E90E16|nr:DUF4352 domain-containing protein [Lentibacillus sp. JNUCC-1]MUV36760.1 hypothetical protein [Lentibacillus sp. JNUCC-1]
MKKMYGLMALAMVFMMLFLGACGESDIEKDVSAANNEEGSNSNNAAKNGDTEDDSDSTESLNVGEAVNFNGVKITLNEARIEPGGEFDTPENDQFIVVNLTAENNSDEEATMSSIMNVELYDDEGYSYSTTILTEGTKGQFDGAIPAGKKLRGEIPFDVPEAESYELHFSDPFQSGKAIWVINSEDLAQ